MLYLICLFFIYIYKKKYAIYILIDQGMTHAGPNFIFYIVYYIILTLFQTKLLSCIICLAIEALLFLTFTKYYGTQLDDL